MPLETVKCIFFYHKCQISDKCIRETTFSFLLIGVKNSFLNPTRWRLEKLDYSLLTTKMTIFKCCLNGLCSSNLVASLPWACMSSFLHLLFMLQREMQTTNGSFKWKSPLCLFVHWHKQMSGQHLHSRLHTISLESSHRHVCTW